MWGLGRVGEVLSAGRPAGREQGGAAQCGGQLLLQAGSLVGASGAGKLLQGKREGRPAQGSPGFLRRCGSGVRELKAPSSHLTVISREPQAEPPWAEWCQGISAIRPGGCPGVRSWGQGDPNAGLNRKASSPRLGSRAASLLRPPWPLPAPSTCLWVALGRNGTSLRHG